MTLPERTSVYDRLRPHLDASDLIARLGLTLARTLGSEAYCAPLCHDSTSGESLQINLHTGRWNCKACQGAGVYGDLFQLVEYTLTGGGIPSRGNAQGSSDGHRQALTWLCEQFGVAFDSEKVHGDAGLDVVHLFAMAAHQHLLGSQETLDWIQEKWGFDRATVESYGLGFMPAPILPSIAAEANRPESRGAFRSSGVGWFPPQGSWKTRFAGRVLFPYLEHGRAIYLIGRATPWTPKVEGQGDRISKYHKLSVHSERRPYVSERVTNEHLYNEPVMRTADEIGVVEGVADAVAVSSLGVAVVSPVTISFNAADLERFVRKCHETGIRRVWILFDNELSGSGNWAARRTGLKLVEGGLTVKILTLPLGDVQQAARDEVVNALGAELFDELERADPRERKTILVNSFPNRKEYDWIISQVEASKIDAAEWSAEQGPAAPAKFNAIYKDGRDVIELEVEELSKTLDIDDEAPARLTHFRIAIELAAHVEDRITRGIYAGSISKAAGKGITKVEVASCIADARRLLVKPKREAAKQKAAADPKAIQRELVILPPEHVHTQPAAPVAPTPSSRPNAPAAPTPPTAKIQSSHERYAPARDAVMKGVLAKLPEESLGQYVSQIILRSMGFTAFKTPEELYLVRGSERIAVDLTPGRPFGQLLYLASGLLSKKSSHSGYIGSAVYFLGLASKKARDVSWSYVSPGGEVFFPTGDAVGSILKIEPGKVTRTKMAEVKVPAVAGPDFRPLTYTEDAGGIERVLEIMRWTSVSKLDRMLLVYWIVCLPVLRRVGTVPIMRIEGGSSSGKTRAVDAVSFLVNGQKSSSVPTSAAMVSRLSTEMLTIDDNRETGDVTPDFLGTLLQATHLGAREKRKKNSDTGTVVERISGALLMNGIEPIHDGRSELASRMLTLRCSKAHRMSDSPSAEEALSRAILDARDSFWSDAARRCAAALNLDRDHGERIGAEIEEIFGATRIGRLQAYLRMTYFAWVAGLPLERQGAALDAVADVWRQAFQEAAGLALRSLIEQELSVTAISYVFAYGRTVAEARHTGSDEVSGLGGKFNGDTRTGEFYLGDSHGIGVRHLTRLVRMAGKELNGPRSITDGLVAGELEARILDGLEFLEAAGFYVEVTTTNKGKNRFTFHQNDKPGEVPEDLNGGDTWQGPGLD